MIFQEQSIDLNHVYLDGTKLKANASNYSWVWKKSCIRKLNSYCKTDHDATFMRVKRDYMGNDQLLPSYNVQLAVCDQYIAHYGVYRFASDMDCFQPMMDGFAKRYGTYPEYPVADACYGSFNNYLYYEKNGMEKYIKFHMYEKETKSEKYRNNPYRATNFPHREVCHKSKSDRIVRINQEVTAVHQEVLSNLNCVHGALLRMNRSIQSEGAFGTMK